MSWKDARRIGIFQAEWPVQVPTANCVTLLTEAGYEVDLFLSKAWTYVDLEKLRALPRARVYDLPGADRCAPDGATTRGRSRAWLRHIAPDLVALYSRANWALERTRRTLAARRRSPEALLPKGIVRETLDLMAENSYRCLIGVEKKGLIWAGQVAEHLQVPYVYYNLELYTDDFHKLVYPKSSYFKRLRLAECAFHRKALATMIEDSHRAEVLFQDNKLAVTDATIFCVPTSPLGPPYKDRSQYLQDTLGIPEGNKIVLYVGVIARDRYVLELVHAAQNFPDDWTLVLHGLGSPSIIREVRRADRRGKVGLSLTMVTSDRLVEVIASAHVGLAFYSPLLQNDRLSAFASEKMAAYLQCGIPFIAFEYPGYRRLAVEDRCGVVIEKLVDLPDAVRMVLADHPAFRERAYRAFAEHYDFARHFAKFIEWIKVL